MTGEAWLDLAEFWLKRDVVGDRIRDGLAGGGFEGLLMRSTGW